MKKNLIIWNILIDSGITPNDLIEYIKIIKQAKKRNWKIIFLDDVMNVFEKENPEFFLVLSSIKIAKREDDKFLDELNFFALSHKKYTKTTFVWTSSKWTLDEIKGLIKKNVKNIEIKEKDIDYIGVEVFGDGSDFKKDFVQDVTKLLS